jgi:hypothetical protein
MKPCGVASPQVADVRAWLEDGCLVIGLRGEGYFGGWGGPFFVPKGPSALAGPPGRCPVSAQASFFPGPAGRPAQIKPVRASGAAGRRILWRGPLVRPPCATMDGRPGAAPASRQSRQRRCPASWKPWLAWFSPASARGNGGWAKALTATPDVPPWPVVGRERLASPWPDSRDRTEKSGGNMRSLWWPKYIMTGYAMLK